MSEPKIEIPLSDYINALVGSREYGVVGEYHRTQLTSQIANLSDYAIIENEPDSVDYTGARLPLLAPNLYRLWTRSTYNNMLAGIKRREATKERDNIYKTTCIELLATKMSLDLAGAVSKEAIAKTLSGNTVTQIENGLRNNNIALPVKDSVKGNS